MEELVITIYGDAAQKDCLNIYPRLSMISKFKIAYRCCDIHEVDARPIKASILDETPYFIKGSYNNVNISANKQQIVLLVDGCKYRCLVRKDEADIYEIFITDQIIN